MPITNKTYHPRIVEVLKAIDEGRKSADFDEYSLPGLLGVYLCALDTGFKNVVRKIELELEARTEQEYIVPKDLFTHLNSSMLSRRLADQIASTTPETLGGFIDWCAATYWPAGYGWMLGYILALGFGKTVVAAQLKKFIQTNYTLSACMPKLLSMVAGMPAVAERIASLAKQTRVSAMSEDFTKAYNEDIEKHETLNPAIFDNEKLKPDVREKAIEVADELLSLLAESGITVKLRDLVITGSNASYNYTKDSDVDLHLIADMSGIEDPDGLYPILFNAYKSAFNKKYEIDFYGVPVEVYIESADTPVVSNGIYSVLNDSWVKVPQAVEIPEVNMEEVNAAVEPWEKRYAELVADIEIGKADENNIDELVDALYAERAAGLTSGNEYNIRNLIFKEMRNRGYLDKLKELRAKLVSNRLSIGNNLQETY